ncbi:MAG: IMP dehydrogenase [SAR324 cluster bacterium]|uniref:IMP dehydrogenase n=1 Tax=SAR324 cluster bacterium TaxID=2024889 RepID=A0A7X9FSW6_9DELT|nr:IMP dehydrogenase [SAR324 cluster bacterium]
MARIIDDISRTFNEFLLLPGLTKKEHTLENIKLKTPLQSYSKENGLGKCLNVPFVSAAMQSVSGDTLAIALARKGGSAFIFCSQPIETQVGMVRSVKEHKAGFVESDSNLSPQATLRDAIKLRQKTGHSTIAITSDGGRHSKLLGILTSKDFWEFKDDLNLPVSDFFTPLEKLVLAEEGATLQEATEKLWKNKKECLPVVDKNGNLKALVFRRDYFDHKSNPDELTDDRKRLFVGAALNTVDYKDRAKALIEAGADCLCFDSSDGYSEWQCEAAKYLRREYGDAIILGGGNVVTAEAFRYLVEEAQLDFVKVGIGGGSICITREQKGIGRGQASSLIDVVQERDRYFSETGRYIPICSDGAINNDTHMIIALALGADFLMMGKYFAMTEESPTKKFVYKDRLYKPYWGEGANRARNWQRYKQSERPELIFEEGVDAFVPYGGALSHKLDVSIAKIKAAMCNIGVSTIKEFHEKAVLTRVSELTIREGGTSTVEQLDRIGMEQSR